MSTPISQSQSQSKKYLYVNPIGDHTHIEYNNVNKLRKSFNTINARLEDSELQSKNHYKLLSIWSITAGISIIALLIFIRKIR